MNNIAEGFEAITNPNVSRFLGYSIQSCAEVISMTYLITELYGNDSDAVAIRKQAVEVRRQLKSFQKYLRHNQYQP